MLSLLVLTLLPLALSGEALGQAYPAVRFKGVVLRSAVYTGTYEFTVRIYEVIEDPEGVLGDGWIYTVFWQTGFSGRADPSAAEGEWVEVYGAWLGGEIQLVEPSHYFVRLTPEADLWVDGSGKGMKQPGGSYEPGEIVQVCFYVNIPAHIEILWSSPEEELLWSGDVPSGTMTMEFEIPDVEGKHYFILRAYRIDNMQLFMEDICAVKVSPAAPPSPAPTPSTSLLFLGGAAAAVALVAVGAVYALTAGVGGAGSLARAESVLKELPERLPIDKTVRLYKLSVKNDSKTAIRNVEAWIDVPPPGILVRVTAKPKSERNYAALGDLGPGEEKTISYIAFYVKPEIESPVAVALPEPKPLVKVRYWLNDQPRVFDVKLGAIVYTEDRIFLRHKLELDLNAELTGIKKDVDAVRALLERGKLKRPQVYYNMLTIQNGSATPISNVQVKIEVPTGELVLGELERGVAVINPESLWRIRFFSIHSGMKTAKKFFGKSKIHVSYMHEGERYSFSLGLSGRVYAPRNVVIEANSGKLEDRAYLLKTVYREAKALLA